MANKQQQQQQQQQLYFVPLYIFIFQLEDGRKTHSFILKKGYVK